MIILGLARLGHHSTFGTFKRHLVRYLSALFVKAI